MTNNEVRVRMSSPIILEGDRIRLDQELLRYDENALIQRTENLYHASQSMIEKISGSGSFCIMNDIQPHKLPTPNDSVLSIDPNSGVWQTYKRKVRYLIVDELVFCCQADVDFVRSALLSIGFLGNFTELGFGEIAEVLITETDHDYSFTKNGKLMRSLPVGVSLDIDLGDDPLINTTYYQGLENCYCSGNLVPCYIPIQL